MVNLIQIKEFILKALGLQENVSAGLKVQAFEMARLLKRLEGYTGVTIKTLKGQIVNQEFLEQWRGGKDGGIDIIIELEYPTEKGLRIAQTRITKILKDRDF